jgi:hypothetical protein
MNDADRIERHRGWIAGLLLVLGVPQGLLGVWALFAPHSFYANLGIGSGHWVAALGAYDEHLVRDIGSLFIGLGVLMVVAAIRLQRSLTYIAVAVWLTFAVPHTIWHMFNLGSYSTTDAVANVISLGWTVVGGLIVLALLGAKRRAPC